MGSPPPVTLHEGFLRVALAGGSADFHLRWLRHQCSTDLHPTTGERTVCSSQLPDALEVSRAQVRDGALEVTWAHDARTSRYPLGWLAEHAYARDRTETGFVTDAAVYEVPLERALPHLAQHGAAILRRVGATAQDTERLIDTLGAGGLKVVGTHFGRIEDLRTDNTTNTNTDQLGYTDAGIDLHTDQPFLEVPPRYQLLHCLRAADRGGESELIDARAAARHLRERDAQAYEVLARTPITFHRKQAAFERVLTAPLFEGGLGEDFTVRFSYFTLAPHRLPFEAIEGYYRAYDRFARLVRRHRLRFLLQPGEALLYDNRRMLHGRTAFSGARWMRGVYFNP